MSEASDQSVIDISGCELNWVEGPEQIVFKLPRWQVSYGRQISVTGPSGSGKTTLLNLVGGMIRPAKGSVRVTGVALEKLKPAQLDAFRGQEIGIVHQRAHLVQGFTVLENMYLALRFGRRWQRHQFRERALHMLAAASAEHLINRKPESLSVGERQRVGVARALVNRPGLVLADEPTGALDPENAGRIENLLRECCREASSTLLLVTHDADIAGRGDTTFDCRDLIKRSAKEAASS